MWVYLGLALIRVLWAILPQSGYIHPDEFFQSVEVTAGDAFNVTAERTWEFDGRLPLRSIIVNKLLFSPTFLFLHHLSSTTTTISLTGKLVLCSSRLVMVCLSFVLDYNLWTICKLWNLNGYTALLMLSASYVTLTYQTHSFSNSVESVLLICVVLTIIHSVKRSSLDSGMDGHVKKGRRRTEKDSQYNVGSQAKKGRETNRYSKYDIGSGEKQAEYNSPYNEDNKVTRGASSNDRYSQYDKEINLLDTKKAGNDHKYDLRHRKTVESSNLNLQPEVQVFKQLSTTNESCDKVQRTNRLSAKLDVTVTGCVILAFLNTLGIFNRPTFALFSVTPFIWWCYCMTKERSLVSSKTVETACFTNMQLRQFYTKISNCFYLFERVGIFTAMSVLFAGIFCILDTCYYRSLTLSDIFDGYKVLKGLVMTPWNFVVYNTAVTNLEKHGRHPFYLHFLVNLPLLFGPLAFIFFKGLISDLIAFYTVIRKSNHVNIVSSRKDRKSISSCQKEKLTENILETSLEKERSTLKYLLLFFIFVPVFFLSIFPHQEPRFLIPLLPLIILYSLLYTKTIYSKVFITFFLLFNIILSCLYGVLHQGGVTPCMFKLQELSTLNEYSSHNTTVLFSHTYMPPRHLLLLKDDSKMNLVDLKGSDLDIVKQTITGIHREWKDMDVETKYNNLLLVIPGSLLRDLYTAMEDFANLTVLEQFFPHLTLDDSPKLTDGLNFTNLINQLSLFLFKVSL